MKSETMARKATALAILCAFSSAVAGTDLYSCTTRGGQRISRDRSIAECADVEQMLRRADGTTVMVPPAETEEERARRVALEEKRKTDILQARREALANRLLVSRFPNETAHALKRAEALAPAQSAIRVSDVRRATLEVEHTRLMREREFYPPPIKEPASLTRAIDANEAALEAQRAILLYQQRELARITAAMDEELTTLRALWAAETRRN